MNRKREMNRFLKTTALKEHQVTESEQQHRWRNKLVLLHEIKLK